jgi:hypothetical protein
MAVLTLEGKIENGRIRLIDEETLPENAMVYVVVPNCVIALKASVYSPRLRHPEQATDFAKQIVEAPADAER